MQREELEMESLSTLLLDPRRLAAIGPTEEELLIDLMWPNPPQRRGEAK